MKKYYTFIILISVFIFVQSCSSSSNSTSGPTTKKATEASYKESYDFTENGCNTGKHEFFGASVEESQKSLCEALQNEYLNKRCAQNLRYQMFKQKCQGYSWNPSDTPSGPPDLDCIKYVAGSYPTSEERSRAARACVGVSDMQAVNYIAGSYPSFSEREEAAYLSSRNLNLECTKFVAGSYPTLQERKNAAGVCHNVKFDCVQLVAGSYPTMTERMNAAKSCGGN